MILTGIYILAVLIGLFIAYFLQSAMPQLNPVLKFFVLPFLAIYLFASIAPTVSPINSDFTDYIMNNTTSMIDQLGYFSIYPPLLFILILFIIFLYSQR
jgi:hypothetical protein